MINVTVTQNVYFEFSNEAAAKATFIDGDWADCFYKEKSLAALFTLFTPQFIALHTKLEMTWVEHKELEIEGFPTFYFSECKGYKTRYKTIYKTRGNPGIGVITVTIENPECEDFS
jgi:hypothetical protein